MNGIVLGIKQTRPTAKMLASVLGFRYEEHAAENPDATKFDVVVRYGNSTTNVQGRTFINSQRAIKLVSDKLMCRTVLGNEGILTPKSFATLQELDACFVEGKKYIARPRFHHGGNGFFVVNTKEEIEQYIKKGYYIQELIDKKDEYRLFIFRDRIIEVNLKVKNRDDADPMIRNHRRGWRFSRKRLTEIPADIRKTCRIAARACGIDFCAIDCCTRQDDKFYILEINSAPGLIERKARSFAERIMALMEGDEHGAFDERPTE